MRHGAWTLGDIENKPPNALLFVTRVDEGAAERITRPMKSPTNSFMCVPFERHDVDSASREKLQGWRNELFALGQTIAL